ncbi:heterokaryon incompatibility protein-domain-containing protein [Apodospora peruviana]|uniref:Heterokaryon incompatibility protein-domain-containing protein n=1 Tax=Apodospora peruviana TaxID=516989 RepID=A0AAE0ICY9_9PEZI|nr:heterokaryon incompatibility protein-domain-containing protein [Apodospora peruviana]
MGYITYYSVNWRSREWRLRIWPQVVEDARLIIEAAGVDLTGSWDERENPIPPIVSVEEGIRFNGIAEDGHETFVCGPKDRKRFTKTNRKPYDLPASCILLRAHYLWREGFSVESDGHWDNELWVNARELYKLLWPGELVWCPWTERSEATGEQTAGYKVEVLNNSSALTPETAISTDSLEDALKKRKLDPESLAQLGPVSSTVSGTDFSHVRQWLFCCDADPAGHSACQPLPAQFKKLPGVTFKIIDVRRRCIVDAPEDCSFVVLTYVWGGVDQPKLTAETTPLLSQEGGLNAIWAGIPTTVRDAIEVCEQIGESYLWVDAICITQDSTRDLKIQILRMRHIYSAAKCTIVVASAASADMGLLGSPPVSGNPCTSENALDSFLETTPWNTRAWCYQEKVLSHRAIIFTSNGIYMQCQQGTYNASTGVQLTARGSPSQQQPPDNPTLTRYNTIGGMLSVPPNRDLESYLSAVEYYSARKLTSQSDKLNAFQGIFQRFRGSLDGKSSAFLYGMPVDGFDQVVCFRLGKHSPQSRNKTFPSWSWLGWDEPVTFDRPLIRTRQMLQCSNHAWTVQSGEVARARKLRRPAAFKKWVADAFDPVGFPAAVAPYTPQPDLYCFASVAYLRIDLTSPVDVDGADGLYAVYPTVCSDLVVRVPFKPFKGADGQLSVLGAFQGDVPESDNTTRDGLDPKMHEGHSEDTCEAKKPVGYIWLDREWVAAADQQLYENYQQQHPMSVGKFMVVAGEKRTKSKTKDPFNCTTVELGLDPDRFDREVDTNLWTITMLMLLQPKFDNFGRQIGDERAQVMDCRIDEEDWQWLGGKTDYVHLY